MPYPMTIPQYSMMPTMMAKGGHVNNARSVRSQGRGNDTMLVHMTPREVGGLQALARARGGSLTINPQTGLPEAGFLDDFFPTLAGLALTVGSGGTIDPVTAGMIVGGGTAAATGDLQQGLLAGLGAYGGAGTGAGLEAAGAATGQAEAFAKGAEALGTTTQAISTPQGMATALGADPTGALNPQLVDKFASQFPTGFNAVTKGLEGIVSTGPEGKLARSAFMQGAGGPTGLAKNIAGISAEKAFETPTYSPPVEEEEEKYEGPYTPSRRTVRYPDANQRRSTSEFTYFTPSNPVPFAEGGGVGSTGANSTSLGSMSAPEAQVFSQIANVQRLAGLPALDTSGFNVRQRFPSVQERMDLVYNPIDGTYTSPTGGGFISSGGLASTSNLGSTGGAERSYGFESLSSHIPQGGVPRQPTVGGGPTFFKPSADFRKANPFVAFEVQGGNVAAQPYFKQNPDRYQEAFEEYTPTGNVIMSNYLYDPLLGGYRENPSFDLSMWGGAKGGSVPELESGGFVLTKKAVDGLGDGDNERGQEVASRGLGAIPIKGPGTGTSDSIKTTIDGKQPARIANGESYVPRKEVQKRGGAKKFYSLMKKAERKA